MGIKNSIDIILKLLYFTLYDTRKNSCVIERFSVPEAREFVQVISDFDLRYFPWPQPR
jgi:hypothetical protein